MSPRSRDEIERYSARYSAPVVCSFCNKPHADVRKMVAGPNGVAICDECVEVCNDIIADTPARQSASDEYEPDDELHLFSFRCPACGHQWKAAKKR